MTTASAEVSDLDLAQRSASGDQGAFGELYERYFDRLFDFAARTVTDRDLANDVVQNTFVKAWRNLQGRDAPEHVKAWLFRIARNEAIDETRRAKRLVSIDDDAAGDGPVFDRAVASDVDEPGRALQTDETAALVWEAASALNPREYTLLDMHVRQELSAEEMASALGVRTGALYTKLSRLRTAVEEAVVSKLLMREGREDCPELDAIVTAHASEEFDRKTRRAIQKHLATCPVCQESKKRIASPLALFGALAPVTALPGMKEAAWASISGQMVTTGGGGSISPAASDRARDWWLISSLAERLIPFVLAAIIAALVIGGGAAAAASGGGEAVPPAQNPADVHSISHEVGVASPVRIIEIVWSGQADAAGFSVTFDETPDNLPDEEVDLTGDATGVTSRPLSDGSWYFHLRTLGPGGDWTGAVHLGPFVIVSEVIDAPTATPTETATEQPTAVTNTATSTPTPTATVSAVPTTAAPSPTATLTPTAPPATATATTVPPTATETPLPPAATPIPVIGAQLEVAATVSEVTTYTVMFSDPQLQAERASFTYNWEMVLGPGGTCGPDLTETGFVWQVKWSHVSCSHPEEQLITVTIERAGYATVLLVGHAIGPYLGP